MEIRSRVLKKMNKKLLVFGLVFVVLINVVSAGLVSRSASETIVGPGEDVVVTLTVDVQGETFYAIDDSYPAGWTMIDDGTGDTSQSGHIKWVVITGAQDTTYTYTIQAPQTEGIYQFDGIYGFEGDTEDQIILGDEILIVEAPQGSTENVVINEILPQPQAPTVEWIELYNKDNTDLFLDGYTIEDNTGAQYSLDGVFIGANNYAVLFKDVDFGFTLNNAGDILILKKNGVTVDSVTYGNFNDGNIANNAPVPLLNDSVGRLPNGVDTNYQPAN
jgi:hypothetical protein